MSNHSNNLQKWISKSENEAIEKLILELEAKYPLEVVVAFTEQPALVPVAAARMIALLALLAELLVEMFWLPVPAWLMGVTVLVFLMLPVGRWQSWSLFRVLARRSERQGAIALQAEECFTHLGLARTKARNALLLFFNMKERLFLVRPDRTLQHEWPELDIQQMVDALRLQLTAKEPPGTAVAKLMESVAQRAQARWQNTVLDASSNELPNAVVWWNPNA